MDKKTALVTGASRGVGRGVAISLGVIAALARHPDIMKRSGQVLVAAAVAEEFGITDIDGRRPKPLTLETV